MIRCDQGMTMYMSSVSLKCVYDGCFWKGKLADYEDHMKECAAKELEQVRQDAKKIEMLTSTLDEKNNTIEQLSCANNLELLTKALDEKEVKIKQLKAANALTSQRAWDTTMHNASQKQTIQKRNETIVSKNKEIRKQQLMIKTREKEVMLLLEKLQERKRSRSRSRNREEVNH